ncbi:hypothetical protein ES703_02625 [subsurface metagenome]
MVSLVDMKRFAEFLDGESLRLDMINPRNYRVEELGYKNSNIDKQIIRVYCQRYDCFDQYKLWIAYFRFQRKMNLLEERGPVTCEDAVNEARKILKEVEEEK